jgi:cytohesin
VQELLEAGCDVNERARGTRLTALHIAARRGYLEIVQLLLAANADLDATGLGGETPLTVAAQEPSREVLSELLHHGASLARVTPTARVWQSSLEFGHTAVVGSLLERALVDPNARVGPEGLCPVHLAARADEVESLRVLVAAGVDLNARTRDRNDSVLDVAMRANSVRIVLCLFGLPRDQLSFEPAVTLGKLVLLGRHRMVEGLLDAEADLAERARWVLVTSLTSQTAHGSGLYARDWAVGCV